ncbi:MAG: Anaphase-promoting complex subunit 23 [Thelocarpon superellum]|nr:MAG: Anaphase-promoting complex subunit 23 [Thelocarpon superellum]
MVGLTAHDANQLHLTLQDAVVKCSERCLYQSAKWAAELLDALPLQDALTPNSDKTEDLHMFEADAAVPRGPSGAPVVLTPNADPEESHLESDEVGKYLLAKSFFDCREYDRCAAVFLPSTIPSGMASSTPAVSLSTIQTPVSSKAKSKASTPSSKKSTSHGLAKSKLPRLSQKAMFLSLYAKFMAGEKRKDEESEMILGPVDGGVTVNRELIRIAAILEEWFTDLDGDTQGGRNRGERSQGWLEYLYGIVLAKGKNDDEARRWLIRSVNLYPYNWGAWQELSSLLGNVENLEQVKPSLPNNLLTFIFLVYTNQEFYQSTEQVHNHLTGLQSIFPESQFLKTQRALLLYHSKDLEEAEKIFSSLVQRDPYRIDSLDHYSNILYVMGSRPKLAFLAQLATATDKFRPETCCVVGNYYSLKSEHEKAVVYFRRALTLDRSFTSAWTLMGHEYVEMKNTHAAIESYRRAVDVNRKDYRAWYGLGQTYEMLEMHYYALFYHQRAASLRPYDPKMWQAVGSCFSKMDRPVDAIKAHKRALIAGTYYDAGSSTSPSFSTSNSSHAGGGGGAGGAGGNISGVMDPDTLYQIALMYDKLRNDEEARAYMELCLAQEDGAGAGADEDASSDDGTIGAPPGRRASAGGGGSGGGGGGVGVTPTTSRARMWLARWEASHGGLQRALKLATELCQDGVEVEEAKALVRDLRARLDAEAELGGAPASQSHSHSRSASRSVSVSVSQSAHASRA